MHGNIKHINYERGFGFISMEDGSSIFFHFSELIGEDIFHLDDYVQYEIIASRKNKGKVEAIKVKLISRPAVNTYFGRIDWFKSEGGFGVVTMPSGKSVFLHQSGFMVSFQPQKGELIRFQIKTRNGREEARGIQQISSTTENLFCLKDKIENLSTLLQSFQSGSTEAKKEILDQQFNTSVADKILTAYVMELSGAEDLKGPVDEVYTLLPFLNRSNIYSSSINSFERTLLDFLIQFASLRQKLSFWLGNIHSEQFFSDEMVDYLLNITDEMTDMEMNKVLAKKKTNLNTLLFRKLILKAIPIDNDKSYTYVTQLLEKVKAIHGAFLGLNIQAEMHASAAYQYKLFFEGFCPDIDLEVIKPRFKEESIASKKEVMARLSGDNQIELMQEFIAELGFINTEAKYEQITGFLERNYYRSIFKNQEKIIQLILPKLSPHFRFILWEDQLINTFDNDFVLTHFQTFSSAQIRRILNKQIKEVNAKVILWKLQDLISAPFGKANFEFLKENINLFVGKEERTSFIIHLLSQLDPLYRFFFWLEGWTEEFKEEICTIYAERKEEIAAEVIQLALQKNYSQLNQLILSDKINTLVLYDQDAGFSIGISIYKNIWQYDSLNDNHLFVELLEKTPIKDIFILGFEIVRPLAQKYLHKGYYGKTFLHIFQNDPDHFEAVNSTYGSYSIFYFEKIFLDKKLFSRLLAFLQTFMAHLSNLQLTNGITKIFQEESLEEKIHLLKSTQKFEKTLRCIEDDYPHDYKYHYDHFLLEFQQDGRKQEAFILLWLAEIGERPQFEMLLCMFTSLSNTSKAMVVNKIFSLISLHKQTWKNRLKESQANKSLVTTFFTAFEKISTTVLSQPLQEENNLTLETLHEQIIIYLTSTFPINNDEAFYHSSLLLDLIQQLDQSFKSLRSTGVPFFKEDRLELLPGTQKYSQLVFKNAPTQYNIQFWVRGLIQEFDYNAYCFYYFLLNTQERKLFNKKAKTEMREKIKSAMLKKRIPWQLEEELTDGTKKYDVSWKAIWFMDGHIKICTSSKPTFSESYPWAFSEEKINFLYDYISGKRLNSLTASVNENGIVEIEGLDELEEVIFKAEIMREIETGTKLMKGTGGNRIPINMVNRNKCIQHLNLLQLDGLEPTRLLERGYNPKRQTSTVDLSLLFSIPLKTEEVVLIWESLELEKAKATHVFRCASSEYASIRNQIEGHLSQNGKVRSALNSRERENLNKQRQLKYIGRVDHDNFNFATWLNRLYELVPGLDRKELIDYEN